MYGARVVLLCLGQRNSMIVVFFQSWVLKATNHCATVVYEGYVWVDLCRLFALSTSDRLFLDS
jgi:hypothetical protein